MQGIIDPSYCSKPTAQSRVYKDREGNLHHPDYRHFPLVASYSSFSSSPFSVDEEEEESYVDPFDLPRRSGSLTRSTRYIYPSSPSSSSSSSSSSPQPSLSRQFDARKLVKNHMKRAASLELYSEANEEESEVEAECSDDEEESGGEEKVEKRNDLTCSEAMKRQLQTMSFSMSVGVFRARRKVKDALQRRSTA